MSKSKRFSADPFSIEADDKSSVGCFQTWADELNVSKYPALKLEKGGRKCDSSSKEKSSPELKLDKGGRKCYPSPKEKKSFLERMEERDRKQTRMRFSPKSVRNLFPNKHRPKIEKKDPIEELHVSPKMKKFIKQEFEREKLKYSFLPEAQVKLQIIHRFKVHIRSSEMSMPKPKKAFVRKTRAKPAKSGKSQRKKAIFSSGDSGYNEESDTDEDTLANKNIHRDFKCFLVGTWADERNVSKYPALKLEKGGRKCDSSSNEKKSLALKLDKGGRKCYPSPKEKKSFLERMEERDRKQTRMRFSPKSVRNLFPNKHRPKIEKKDLIEELHVSPKMKKFIKQEFEREKLKYSFLPEAQVKLQIIHRFKVHIRSSEMSMPKPKKTFLRKTRAKPAKSNKSQRKKARFSSGDSGYNEESDTDEDTLANKNIPFNLKYLKESDEDDANIEEYEDANLPVFPSRGAFEICPSKDAGTAMKPILVCFHPDSDTDSIADSSQETQDGGLNTSSNSSEKKEKSADPGLRTPIKFYKDLSPSPRKRRPKLPYLLSSSPNVGNVSLECDVAGDELAVGKIDVAENDSDIKMQFFGFQLCFDCLTKRDDDLLVCSGCDKATYCNEDCQLTNWNFHRKFCRKIKTELEMSPKETEEILLNHLKNASKKSRIPESPKFCSSMKSAKKRSGNNSVQRKAKKSVKFLSQPEYECEEPDAEVKTKFKKTPVKSILKQKRRVNGGHLQSMDEDSKLNCESNQNDENQDQENKPQEELDVVQEVRSDKDSISVENVDVDLKVDERPLEKDFLNANKEIEDSEKTVISETDSECENSMNHSLIHDTSKENTKQAKEYLKNANRSKDGQLELGLKLPKSTPENSPQMETEIKSVGVLGPKSSNKRSKSRTKPEGSTSSNRVIKLGDEYEELEISFSQNEEDNNQAESYLPLPKKLTFEDITEDCNEQNMIFDKTLNQTEEHSDQTEIQKIEFMSEEQNFNISDIDLGSSFLSSDIDVNVDFDEYFNGNDEEMFKVDGNTAATLEPSLNVHCEPQDKTISKDDGQLKEKQGMSPSPLQIFENSETTGESDSNLESAKLTCGYLRDMFDEADGDETLESLGGSSIAVDSNETLVVPAVKSSSDNSERDDDSDVDMFA